MDELKRLIESRQAQAAKKQLTLKMLCIAKNLGQVIEGDPTYGTGLVSSVYDPDEWMVEENPDEIKEAPDADYGEYGYIFDSLAYGQNLEIRYLHSGRELRASYNGYTVYKETDGTLTAYSPNEKWEEFVDFLHKKAKVREEERSAKQKEQDKQTFMKQAAKFLRELRDAWGI